MNREDILTKAMAIAKRNGFGLSDDFFTEIPTDAWLQEGQDLYYSLIFCHDFAISFFGEGKVVVEECAEEPEQIDLCEYETPMALLMSNRKNISIPIWQYHLIQMSLCEDPLLYISKFITDYEQVNLN